MTRSPADLARSRYSTRGQATCSTKMTGSLRPTRCRSRSESRLAPKRPSCRNGLMMPGDQLTPVIILRSSPASSPSQPKAVSTRYGIPSSSCSATLAIVEAVHLGSRRARKRASKWSRPMMPSADRLDRPGMLAHRVEQRRAEDLVDGIADDQVRERRAGQPGRPRAPWPVLRSRRDRGTPRRTRARCGSVRARRRAPGRRRSAGPAAPACTSAARSGPMASTCSMPAPSPPW